MLASLAQTRVDALLRFHHQIVAVTQRETTDIEAGLLVTEATDEEVVDPFVCQTPKFLKRRRASADRVGGGHGGRVHGTMKSRDARVCGGL